MTDREYHVSDLTLSGDASRSPFDRIRHIRVDGSEYWSAREMGAMMGYADWRNLRDAVERAKAAARNAGASEDGNFGDATGVSGARGPAAADVNLSRYAAYLVAMNGDPRKPEVAKAQAYFAVKTREAEVSSLPTSFAEALQLAADQAREIEEKTAQIEANAPKVLAWEGVVDRDGHFQAGDVARAVGVGRTTLMAFLRERGILLAHPRNQPCAEWSRKGWAVARENGTVDFTGRVRTTTVFSPAGVERVTSLVAKHFGDKA